MNFEILRKFFQPPAFLKRVVSVSINKTLFCRAPHGRCVVLFENDDICIKDGWCWVKWHKLVDDSLNGRWEYQGRKFVNPLREVRVLKGFFRGITIPLSVWNETTEQALDRLRAETDPFWP